MEKFLEWLFRFEAMVTAVDWESEFNPLGMEEKVGISAICFFAIEAVARNRHSKSLLRSGMHPKLMSAPRQWMKHYAAAAF